MRKLTIPIAIVTGLIAPSALAADVAVKAPPAAPAPVYSWTGWYAGVNLGASFGNAKTDFNVAPVTVTNIAQSATSPAFDFSNTDHPSGFIGGGQVGYNWQYSPQVVVGLEADFQGALERDSNNLSDPFIFSVALVPGPGSIPVGGTVATNYTTKIDWFGTVRGRIGYVWGNGEVLTYLTGGLAYGKVELTGTSTVAGTAAGAGFLVTQTIGHSQVNTGWVLGYGTEGRIGFLGSRNWTWKIEGLYMDLGHLDAAGVISSSLATPGFLATGGQVTTHTHFTDGVLRAGLNYQFH